MVVTFNLAVNRRFVKEGEERQADFFTIVAWGKTGEFCSKYFKKGQQVGVIGRLQSRSYDDKDGKRVYVVEVIAEEVYFADSAKGKQGSQDNQPTTTGDDFVPVTDDDLPF